MDFQPDEPPNGGGNTLEADASAPLVPLSPVMGATRAPWMPTLEPPIPDHVPLAANARTLTEMADSDFGRPFPSLVPHVDSKLDPVPSYPAMSSFDVQSPLETLDAKDKLINGRTGFASSSASLSSTSSESDIEMANLDDISVTPLAARHNDYGDDENLGDEDGDEGRQSLLPLWPSDGFVVRRSHWPQVKDIVLECAPTLLLTTVGMLFTGELLDHVSKWRAMKRVDELIIILPVVLNLLGNIQMNLSARLGTAANVGELDIPQVRWELISGNMTLLQVQAAVVSFVAACVSFLLGFIVPRTQSAADVRSVSVRHRSLLGLETHVARQLSPPKYLKRRPRPILPLDGHRNSGLSEIIVVVSCAMTAACLSSLTLGAFMCTLIVLCRRFKRDPDNIAPPVASCLGDLFTLSLLGAVSTVLIGFLGKPVLVVVILLILISSVLCGIATYQIPSVRPLMTQGWTPLFISMAIECGTGIVLDLFVNRYDGYGLLAVAICGLPGSVGAVLVSRLSTSLHAAALARPSHTRSRSRTSIPIPPPRVKEPSQRLVMATLLLVAIPVEIIFLAILRALGWLRLPLAFVAMTVVAFCCVVIVSLCFARWFTYYLWSKNLDPDVYALPIHCALMDLIGQLLLVVCFEIGSLLGLKLRVR